MFKSLNYLFQDSQNLLPFIHLPKRFKEKILVRLETPLEDYMVSDQTVDQMADLVALLDSLDDQEAMLSYPTRVVLILVTL
jgi:hypothetical protein